MANKPQVQLTFHDNCGDCGKRTVTLPEKLPALGDDFDWDIRDYDGFRLFMLEELAARFPERRHWMPADMEVLMVETLAVVLDQLADMHDRIHNESYLETARRPDTVRRLLKMIGYDATKRVDARMLAKITENTTAQLSGNISVSDEELKRLWNHYPHLMEQAKQEGPQSIQQQRRMVTLVDYRLQLINHPLVLDVHAYSRWTGSWNSHFLVIRLINNLLLDEALSEDNIAHDPVETDQQLAAFMAELQDFYQQQEISHIPMVIDNNSRALIQDIVQQQRMVNQEVILEDVVLVGIILSISVKVNQHFYRSEIEDAITNALLSHNGGFFSAQHQNFGQDVVASDIIQALMNIDGIDSVCINRLKRIGSIYPDQSGSGRIILTGSEVAVLENNASTPQRGLLTIKLHGGHIG